MDKIIVPTNKVEINLELLKDRPKEIKPEVKADKVELSENIKKFDSKRKAVSPYDYNSVSLNKRVEYTPTADQMITNPTYNAVGKFLGVDTVHDWGKYHDKVRVLVDWAETKTGSKDINPIMDFLNGALNAAPSFGMNNKRIDQLYSYARLNMTR